jgi:hypothetical protein
LIAHPFYSKIFFHYQELLQAMKCPVTGLPMMVVERDKIELDYCPDCGGIWFDAGELELFAESIEAEVRLPDFSTFPSVKSSEKARRSPRTGKEMDKINLGSEEHQLLIDRDRDGYGLWFDRGELARVLERFIGSDAHAGTGRVLKFLSETIHY